MRFNPGGVMRKAVKKTGKLVSPGGVMKRPAAKKKARKAARKPVKPKRPLRVNPGGVMRRPVPAPRPSPATG